MEYSILAKSFDNVISKNDFTLLKKELFKYINSNFETLGFNDVGCINNFTYNDLAKRIINKSYILNKDLIKLAYYAFKEQEDYYNILDYIILYTYELAQSLYIKKSVEGFHHKSLTEILLLNRLDFGKYGLNIEYPYHQLSVNYKSNPYIQNYLSSEGNEYLKNIKLENLSDNKIMYLKIAEDIFKLLELRQGFHYKNAHYLIKDRLFALCQCLKNLDVSDVDIEDILRLLNKDFQLNIKDSDITFLANTKTYKYGKDKLADKIKYNFVRSKEFNYFNL